MSNAVDLASQVYAYTIPLIDACKDRALICSTSDFQQFCLLALEDLNVAPDSGAEECHEPLLRGVQHWIHECMRDAQVDVVGRAALRFLYDDVVVVEVDHRGVKVRAPWEPASRRLTP